MKKIVIMILVIGISIVNLTACGESKDNDKDIVPEESIAEMKPEEITHRLNDIMNDSTDIWNHVICDLSHYAYNGTDSCGREFDIEFMIQTMDTYYDPFIVDKEFVDDLGEEYANVIVAFDNMYDMAISIHDHLEQEIPIAGEPLPYEDEIDLFWQYYVAFSNAIPDNY